MRQRSVRFNNRISSMALGLTEQAHKRNVHIVLAEHMGNVRHNAGGVFVNDN